MSKLKFSNLVVVALLTLPKDNMIFFQLFSEISDQ